MRTMSRLRKSPAVRSRRHVLPASLVLILLAAVPAVCAAHPLSVQECLEGSEFIHNAALARDNGIKRAFFIDRLAADIEAIRAFPPSLRWFVQDDEDAEFLSTAAARVFDAPVSPQQHQSDFLAACLNKPGAAAGSSSRL